MTAGLYQVATGCELRVDYGGELAETQLSRQGEGPLVERAGRLRHVLEQQGWALLAG